MNFMTKVETINNRHARILALRKELYSEVLAFGRDVADIVNDGDCRKLIMLTSDDRFRTIRNFSNRLRDLDPDVRYNLSAKIDCAGETCKELKVITDAVNVIVSMTKEDSD